MTHPTARRAAVVLIVVAAVATAACLPGTPQATRSGPPGFLVGIWHGWIAPLSLVLGFLNPGIRIYEARNAGWAYDCGFYIAIISGFGGFSLFRRKRKK